MNAINDPLNEREFELVNIVGAQLAANQRELSRQMNISLGMTNMLLRRLITKGYIRINQLNSKKVSYILTPKGFSEKMQKSIKYTLKTINSIGLIKKQLLEIFSRLHQDGHKKYYVLGKSDLAGLIKMILMEKFNHDYELMYIDHFMDAKNDGVILICTEDKGPYPDSNGRCIHLLEELAKHDVSVG